MKGLKDKAAVITGASGGLGSHLVRHFSDLCGIIFSIDIDCQENCSKNVVGISADLSTPSGVEKSATIISLHSNAIEILINCAGIFCEDAAEEKSWTTFEKLWKTNTLSTVMLTLRLEKLLAAGESPMVINIASTDGVVASAAQDCELGVSHDVLYAISKGALLTFTRALAMKWASLGVRVNALCPTIFPSKMTSSLLGTTGKKEELARRIPLGRLCTTQDVVDAAVIAYNMQMTTGHLFTIDGGYLCQ